jgi:single-strand DNA-binding protein
MADGLNKVLLIGNLGTDPEMRYTANGSAVTTFRIAVTRGFNSPDGERREETEWFTVVAWSKLAEVVGTNLHKGRKVFVEGRLQTRSWERDNVKHWRTEVIAERVLFLDRAQGAPLPDTDLPGDVEPDDLPFE